MERPVDNQELETQGSENNLSDILDLLSGVGLVGGVVGSFINNITLAAIPISVALALQMANRRRMAVETAQVKQTIAIQASTQVSNNQAMFLEKIQQLQQETQKNLHQQRQDFQTQVSDLSDKMGQSSQIMADFTQDHEQLKEFTQSLETQQQQLEQIISGLQKINNFSQAIQHNSEGADIYYQRGLSHQELGDKARAIADYTQALRLDSTYAKAYHSRGILVAELGNKKQAAEDLRLAAKYYFDQGDIESYKQARSLSKEFYAVRYSVIPEDTISETDRQAMEEAKDKIKLEVAAEALAVGSLFSSESDSMGKASILG